MSEGSCQLRKLEDNRPASTGPLVSNPGRTLPRVRAHIVLAAWHSSKSPARSGTSENLTAYVHHGIIRNQVL